MMARVQRAFLTHIYRSAEAPERLPWHSEKPPELLCKAVEADTTKGRALDVGCGSGVFALWLAQHGYGVTAMDFLEEAVGMARERVRNVEPSVEVVCASALEYEPREPFDLVLDRGCLHTLQPSVRPQYRERLLRWLKPGGSYVLVHLGRRSPIDWRPVGPRRRSREEVLGLFAPELEEVEHRSAIQPLPLPVGPTVQLNSYWFRRRG
jgi:SAM-dependent methyltransferase